MSLKSRDQYSVPDETARRATYRATSAHRPAPVLRTTCRCGLCLLIAGERLVSDQEHNIVIRLRHDGTNRSKPAVAAQRKTAP